MLKKPLILHEGYPFIAGALLIAVILAWAGHIYVAVIPFVLSCYFTFFSDVLTGITVFLKERIFWFLLPMVP